MKSLSSAPRVAVIGGGITGLTAAWQLQRSGLAPLVFERAPHLGGAIGVLKQDGWLHERGPNSLLEGSSNVSALVEDLGLTPRRLYAAPEAKQRYIVRRGRPVAMPTSPLSFLATSLFSWRAKLNLLGEPWRRRSPAHAEESVAEFVRRRLGQEFLDYAINPFVGGVYAGDPARLSVRHAFPKLHALEQEHGSLIRGALRRRNTSGGPKGRIFSFPDGLSEIPQALARDLGPRVRCDQQIIRVIRREDDWQIEVEQNGATMLETFAAVIVAVPADALAKLVIEGLPAATQLKLLSSIAQPAVSSVFLGYRRSDVAHPLDGFGLLAPEIEHRKILGTLFSSSLFPGRAPAGCVALTSFVGGMRNPLLARLDEPALVQMVHEELAALLGVRAQPIYSHVQRWPRAIPQYDLDYGRFKDAITSVERAAPSLFIGGNARDGIALSNCIASGQRLAEAATAHLRSRQPIAVA